MRTREAVVGKTVMWRECRGIAGSIVSVNKATSAAEVKFPRTGVTILFSIDEIEKFR
jgi:hypothetical protein